MGNGTSRKGQAKHVRFCGGSGGGVEEEMVCIIIKFRNNTLRFGRGTQRCT